MSVYLDASVLVSLLVPDTHWPVVSKWVQTKPHLAFSPWTITEATSALSHQVRLGRLTSQQRMEAERRLDLWQSTQASPITVQPDDFATARQLIQRQALLRAGDALHLAIALRMKLMIATLDARLADAALGESLEIAF